MEDHRKVFAIVKNGVIHGLVLGYDGIPTFPLAKEYGKINSESVYDHLGRHSQRN